LVWLDANEDTLLADLMEAEDPRIKLEVWKELRRYGYGAPPTRLEINVAGPSPEQILQEIADRRRSSIETSATALLENGDPNANDRAG